VTLSSNWFHAVVAAAALTGVAACTSPPPPAAAPPTTAELSTPAVPAPVPDVVAPRTRAWVDLKVGDCVAAVPAVELGEVSVTMSDCAVPHQAEVYLLAPIAVDTALTDVANQQCAEGLGPYVGGQAADYAVTYLIDSRQDRTDNNPMPSTVICLLQRNDGQPLTASARR
jgi:hypothetical protein